MNCQQCRGRIQKASSEIRLPNGEAQGTLGPNIFIDLFSFYTHTYTDGLITKLPMCFALYSLMAARFGST